MQNSAKTTEVLGITAKGSGKYLENTEKVPAQKLLMKNQESTGNIRGK